MQGSRPSQAHSSLRLRRLPTRLSFCHFIIPAARDRDAGAAVALGAESGRCLALQSTLRVLVSTIMVHYATSCWASQRSSPPWCQRRRLPPMASSKPTRSTTAAASSSLSSVFELYSPFCFLFRLLRRNEVIVRVVDCRLIDRRFMYYRITALSSAYSFSN